MTTPSDDNAIAANATVRPSAESWRRFFDIDLIASHIPTFIP